MVTEGTFFAKRVGGRETRGVEVFGSCQCVCQRIPSQPQHLVPECHVLATKHNSSVSLSGCHFTKPEITRNHIHMWENKREGREDGVKHDFHPQLCPQELLRMVFSFGCADKSAHRCPTSYYSLHSNLHPSLFNPIPRFPASLFQLSPSLSFSLFSLLLLTFLHLPPLPLPLPPPSIPTSIHTLRHVVIVQL